MTAPEWLSQVGPALWGSGWENKLAAEMGIKNVKNVQNWANGTNFTFDWDHSIIPTIRQIVLRRQAEINAAADLTAKLLGSRT